LDIVFQFRAFPRGRITFFHLLDGKAASGRLMMTMSKKLLAGVMLIFGVGLIILPSMMARPRARAALNSWRGITPLHSSAADVARQLGLEGDSNEGLMDGPFKVEGGEVTFSYLTPSAAKIYRAPKSLVGKVFTIYFKPNAPTPRSELKLAPGFKKCTDQLDRTYYYFVNDAGLAYQIRRGSDDMETIIYQPSRAEIRRLAVNTSCVF
jgi:hypothetical protein